MSFIVSWMKKSSFKSCTDEEIQALEAELYKIICILDDFHVLGSKERVKSSFGTLWIRSSIVNPVSKSGYTCLRVLVSVRVAHVHANACACVRDWSSPITETLIILAPFMLGHRLC